MQIIYAPTARYIHVSIKNTSQHNLQTTNRLKATYFELKCIHDASYKCFHHETFIGEASSELGPHLNYKRSRITLGLNRTIILLKSTIQPYSSSKARTKSISKFCTLDVHSCHCLILTNTITLVNI